MRTAFASLLEERTPLPYANGWFALCTTGQLKRETVLTIPFMGKDVVMYRTRSGEAQACNPYCPHLGAHLGYGGRVEGENLVCPFHGFAFGKNGVCVHACGGHRPPRIALKHLPVCEANGLVYAWHHDCGEAPSWELPALDLSGFVRSSYGTIDAQGYTQDIAENVVDNTHFKLVHGLDAGTMIKTPVLDGPRLKGGLNRYLNQDVSIDTTMHGLGMLTAEFELPRFGIEIRLLLAQTQLDRFACRIRYAIAVKLTKPRMLPEMLRRGMGRLLAELANRTYNKHVIGQDRIIFSHRSFRFQPGFCAVDAPFSVFRRWSAQFYPGGTFETVGDEDDGKKMPQALGRIFTPSRRNQV